MTTTVPGSVSRDERQQAGRTLSNRLTTIFVVALLFRLLIVVYVAKYSDALDRLHSFNEAVGIARALATQHAFATPFHDASGPTAWIAPVYPMLLAGIFTILGVETKASLVTAAALNSLFAALTAVVIHKIGSRQFGERIGAIAAWVWAVCPYLMLLVFLMWEAALSALLLSCAIYLTLRAELSSRKRDWIVCGLFWGLQALTSPAVLSVLPFWLLYLWGRTRRLLPSATIALTMIFVISPWCIRNQIELHDGLILRSNGWAEVYFANISNDSHPTKPTSEYQALGEMGFSRLMRQRVLNYITHNPSKFAADSARHFARFWIVPVKYWPYTTFLALGTLVGVLIAIGKYGARAVPLLGVLLLCPAIYYFCFTFARYRHPVEPTMFLFTALAVNETWTRLKRRELEPVGTERLVKDS